MVVFRYQRNPQGVYFPVIPITLFGPEDTKLDSTALIDSGANISIFNEDVAGLLEVDVEKGEEIFLGGVGGRIKGHIHNIKAELDNKLLEIPVVFSYEYTASFNLLGRKGFFEGFKITFDEKRKTIELA